MKTLLLFSALLVGTLVTPREVSELEVGKRVLGSQPASIGQFPYQAFLVNPNGDLYCGGSIVTVESILTAAQCDVQIGDYAIGGALGSSNLISANMVQIRYVSSTLAHPDFNSPVPLANDIRVVKIDPPYFDFSSPFVGPVNLPTIPFEDYDIKIERTLSGWSFPFMPLQYTINYVLDDASCIGPSSGVFIPSMLCTQTLADACPLDLGGPLVDEYFAFGTIYNGVTQIGILSFGYQCSGVANPQNQLGYTQLSHHLNWIYSNI